MAKTTGRKKTSKVVREVKTSINKDEVLMQISTLRSEMTHYVLESVSVSILALLLFIGAPSVFPEIINPFLPSSLQIMQAFVAVPLVFWLVTVFSNMFRYFKILKLQDRLKS